MSQLPITPSGDEKNSRVELLIKREEKQQENTMEIDLVQVIRNMGEKKRIYAWVLVLCFLVGLAVPMVLYQVKTAGADVSSVLTLNSESLTKDGAADISYLSSTSILTDALKKTVLSKGISVDSLKNNIQVERLLTEESRQKMEILSSLTDKEEKEKLSSLMDVEFEYTDQYVITLKNGFGSGDGKKVTLAETELASLLDNILRAYRDYCYEAYAPVVMPVNALESVDLERYDLQENLEMMDSAMNGLISYCGAMAQNYSDYRGTQDGLSFADLQNLVQTAKRVSVDYLYSYVHYNHLVKANSPIYTKLNYQLRNVNLELDVIEQNIKTTEGILQEYQNDQILMPNLSTAAITGTDEDGNPTTETTGQNIVMTTDYYNELVLLQTEYLQQKADKQIEKGMLEFKLSGMTEAGSLDSAKMKLAESEMSVVLKTCSEAYDLVRSHGEEFFSDASYKNTLLDYTSAQYFSSSFTAPENVKKVLIGAVVGLLVGAVLWGCDGLVMEFKRKPQEGEVKAK